MKFITNYANLDVTLVPQKNILNPGTGEVIDVLPALAAKFRMGVYETEDNRTIGLLLKLLERRRNDGTPQTFQIHPTDLHLADTFVFVDAPKTNYPDPDHAPKPDDATTARMDALEAKLDDLVKILTQPPALKTTKKTPTKPASKPDAA